MGIPGEISGLSQPDLTNDPELQTTTDPIVRIKIDPGTGSAARHAKPAPWRLLVRIEIVDLQNQPTRANSTVAASAKALSLLWQRAVFHATIGEAGGSDRHPILQQRAQ